MPHKSTGFLMKRLFSSYVRPYTLQLVIAVFFMAIAASMTAAVAFMIESVLDDVLSGKNPDAVIPIGVTMLGVFPPMERNGRFLIDGALTNPVPVAPCLAMGARMTIAVDLHADVIGKATKPGESYPTVAGFDMFDSKDISPAQQKKIKNPMARRLFRREENDHPSLFGVMVSSLGIMMDRLTRSRLAGDTPDIHIKPKIGHIGLLEFEKADELIAAGEEAALEVIDDIREAARVLLPPVG